MKSPGILSHLASILALPFTVVVIVPFLLLKSGSGEPSQYLDNLISWIRWSMFFIFAIAGLSLFIWTNLLFDQKGKGTLAPWNPTKQLVVVGPYQYMRNPMITSVILLLLAEALFFNAEAIFVWALLFFSFNHLYFIVKEEPDTLKRFGDDYREYKTNVPRWIPRLSPWKSEKDA